MLDLYLDVGRVYHTSHDSDLEAEAPMHLYDEWKARLYNTPSIYASVLTGAQSDVLISASTAESQMRFELGAVSPLRCREHNDPRAEKMSRLNLEYGWWGAYTRDCKRWHGGHARGPANRVEYPTGRVYTGVVHVKPSFTCWKDNGRTYQAHDRVRGIAHC